MISMRLVDTKYIKNWKKLSSRFGKNFLLELFENGSKSLSYNNNDFDLAFGSKVINKIKIKKDIEFVEKETYINLSSMFGKFIHFFTKWQKELTINLDYNNADSQKIQEETKNTIIKNIKYHNNIIPPRYEQLREDEKEIFSMDEEWNIILPIPY